MSKIVLEPHKRLSESSLWQLQYNAYCQFGIGAWSKKGVPSYITSNAYIAKRYAHIVLGFLNDGMIQNIFDFNHPIYLFDLGAGTGRFAYLFLRELFRLIEKKTLSQIKLCYVMTDIATENIEFWQNHSYLKPFFEQGVLECARFHHSQSLPIHLIRQNKQLLPEGVINPIVVIANYFFDTIPQELFRVHEGRLEEGRIALSTSNAAFTNLEDPAVINYLKFNYSYHPLESSVDYYDDTEDNDILEMYRSQLTDTTFLFPCGAFQVLRTFKKLSHSRMMLLAGDQGVCTLKQVQEWGDPTVSLHGSFSISVSYHALAALFRLWQGEAFLTTFSDPTFVVMCAVINQGLQNKFIETKLAFEEQINNFEPTEFWKFVWLTEHEWKTPPLDQLLLLIKLGNWDAISLHAFYPLIKEYLPKATEKQKDRLIKTIHYVWENYYPVAAEEAHFIMNVGDLFQEMNLPEQAQIYFERAQNISNSFKSKNSN